MSKVLEKINPPHELLNMIQCKRPFDEDVCTNLINTLLVSEENNDEGNKPFDYIDELEMLEELTCLSNNLLNRISTNPYYFYVNNIKESSLSASFISPK